MDGQDGQSWQREFFRGSVAIAADMRTKGGFKVKVKIVDISQSGFRMECLTYVSFDQVIFITMPTFQQLEVRIIWQTEWMYGCEFIRPLHAAILDHILKAFPALDAPVTNAASGMIYGAAAGLEWNQSSL